MAGKPQTINEEAGLGPNWVPLDGPPIIPGQMIAAPPASDFVPTNPKYIQGTIAPNFQHDSSFVDTGDRTAHIPKFDLMPLGPQQNAISSAQISSTVRSVAPVAVPIPPAASADDDLIKLNLQTGKQYTVQLSDLNKLISISNVAGGTIYLPPVAGSTGVAVTNSVPTPFNSGNTTIVGQVATSVYVFTPSAAVASGDFMFLAIRNVSSHSDGVSLISMKDSANGSWTQVATVSIDDVSVGTDTLTLFYVRNTKAIAAGASITLTFSATYATSVFNPADNAVWVMTGIKAAGGEAQNSGLSSGSTFSSGGVTVGSPTTFISIADSNNGSLATLTPANSQGKAWTNVSGGSGAARFNYIANIFSGFVNDVYTPSASGHGFIDILAAFTQAVSADIQELTTDFFCYVENTGAGTFNLVSAAPIDGSFTPLPLAQNQGMLLLWDAPTQAWYTERGAGGGGTDTDFYQTVQQAGTSKPQEGKLNFLDPVTAADNAGAGSTDITVPDMVGDSGSGGKHGLVPAPASGDAAANKFLKASGSFAVPPTMVGDSGSGGTAGYAPAPGAGDNAAGKFLSAGGTYVNPGSNPASFNTGLVYAIAAGYALG